MGALIETLHGLYEIERELRNLQQRIAAKKRQANIQARRVAGVTGDLESKRAELQQRKAETAEHDLEVKVFEEKIAKLRTGLNQVKTNKEYSAILTEINTTKADSTKLEDRTLILMEDVDAITKVIGELKIQHKADQAKLTSLRSACTAFEKEVADELAALEEKRDEAASDIPPSVRATFERVADSYDGEALAIVVQVHPKRLEFSCGGCHMSVPLELVNALKSREDIQCCNVCGRILYVEDLSGRPVS